MPVEISAEFETPDMADFALSTLRRNNIELHSYTIRAARRFNQHQKSSTAEAVNMWPFAFSNFTDMGRGTAPYEEPSEVILTAIVPDNKGDYARELMCGAHGLHIK